MGIYCDQPAKVLAVKTQDDSRIDRPSCQAVLAMISPQTSVKLVGGHGTSVSHMLTMAFDDPTIDDLRKTLAAYEIVLGDNWANVE